MTMKKLSFFAALVVAMTAVSCVEDINDGAPVADNGATVFTATFDATAASKAVLIPGETESKVEWEAGDQVSVLTGEANYLYASNAGGATTTLYTQATDVPTEGTFYAVYPYNADATVVPATVAETPDSISTVLPAQQTAVKGSFATHLAVAQAVENKFAFKNVCALVKVNIAADGVTKIVFEGNNSEVVAGGINVAVADAPAWKAVVDQGATSVTLASASALEAGDYFFAVLPQTFAKGFKVTAYKGEQSWVVRNVTASTTLERAGIVGGKSFFEIEGNGTEANPYILKTPAHLVGMRSLATLKGETWFKMANDIDMQGVTRYLPVNYDQNYERKIHFDGGDFTISNLYLDKSRDGGNYTSLFGVLNGSVKNLKIDKATIKSTNGCGVIGGYVGTDGIAAEVENVTITNSSVTSSGNQVGGVCGVAYGASFKNVSYQGTVASTYYNSSKHDEGRVGGFAGLTRGTVLCESCHVDAAVSVQTNQSKQTVGVGGFIGRVLDGSLTATGSTVKGSVTGTNYLGGFIGGVGTPPTKDDDGKITDNGDYATITLTSCSSEAAVDGSSGVAALVGYFSLLSSGTMTECHTVGTIKGANNVAGLVGLIETGSSKEFTMTKCSYKGSSINATGTIGGLVGNLNGVWNISYSEVVSDITGSNNYVGGLIGSCNAADYNLTEFDIQHCNYNGNVKSTAGNYVGGVLGVIQTKPKSVSISNVTSQGTVNGVQYVGGCIGAAMCANESTISDSWSSSNVTSTGIKTGGFVGAVTATSTFKNCYATGTVESSARSLGGFIGHNNGANTTLTNCYATGDVKSTTDGYAGGFLGNTETNKTILTGCHATGKVTCASGNNLGGLVGVAQANIDITQCYATGDVVGGTAGRCAGILGQVLAKAVIKDCYSTSNVTATGMQHGGIVGFVANSNGEADIQNCYATGVIGTGNGCAGIVGNSRGKANGTSVQNCIAWNPKVSTTARGTGNYAPAAIVGSCYLAGTFKNCWRRADMELVDNVNLSKLIDQDDCVGQLPTLGGTADDPNRVYQGKAAAADATISSVAKTLGWDETIWDLSKDIPTLK